MGFQHQMTIPFNQIVSGRGIGVLVGLVTFIGFFLLFNKTWCGFACLLGTIQEWITKLRNRFGIRYSTYSEPVNNRLKPVKYVLLALLILIPMGIGNSIAEMVKATTIEINRQGDLYLNAEPSSLDQIKNTLMQKDRSQPILIRADKDIALQVFVDVMDVVKGLGFTRVSLQTRSSR